MWRYPSTASFLEGLWPFRPRKFEAITGIPSKRESSARVDYVPALCTHRPSLLPIEWSGEVLGSRRRGRCARSHSAEGTSAWASRIASPPTTPPQWGCVSFGAETGLPCPWCGWPKKESPLTDARLVVVVKAFVSSRADAREALSNDPNVSSCNDALTATPADGGRRCVPVGCGTARAGPPIDSGRGPVRIGAAAKARAVDMPVEMPSRRSWLAARAVTACLGTCVLPAPACGHPIRPVLKHGPRSLTCVGRRGCFVEPCHGIESSKWAIFGKQNWRCGMNRKPGYGAKLRANLEPTKGVGRLRQQDGGHGSRNPLRSV
ncbi:hypothetical protein L6452_46288 [Arctium lappa]|nr:hypothetical protein L6452_46288 [Arctium lappa]